VADIIQLLSDHLANQIAAGEVITRPSAAVKELMENAIDAGATEIHLIVRDAGKELIQVTDNGKGMSPTDARMSFERHATSKISKIEDLFSIRTMGFRGEALASIAAVAQVEMKTKQPESESGTRIVIEGTVVKLQEACATASGTSIAVKNLFYNVPARRNFLKSNTSEYKAILDEFVRIALAYPEIKFRLWNNNTEQFRLETGSLKSRIIGLLGSNYEKKLVPIEEVNDFMQVHGFIGRPETALKTRGNQFFFVNGRFIKNQYLNHAVVQAFDALIPAETFPFYVLFIETDPSRVDVNVHPTKQEVKFDDDRTMHAYLKTAVKHALARNNIAPSLDFTLNPEIMQLEAVRNPVSPIREQKTQSGYLSSVFAGINQAHVIERKDSLKAWKQLYEVAANNSSSPTLPAEQIGNSQAELRQVSELDKSRSSGSTGEERKNGDILLFQDTYLASTIKSGFVIIHIRRALERIIFNKLQSSCNNNNVMSQQLLFPESYECAAGDAALLTSILPDLAQIGFDITPFGNNSFVIHGVPAGLNQSGSGEFLEDAMEHLKNEGGNASERNTELLLQNLARKMSRNIEAYTVPENRQALVAELFGCSQPEYSPTGRKIFTVLSKADIDDLLN
jgi:DNA mismatch repair protein MutL